MLEAEIDGLKARGQLQGADLLAVTCAAALLGLRLLQLYASLVHACNASEPLHAVVHTEGLQCRPE